MKNNTKLIDSGRSRKWTHGAVNPAIIRTSTVTFETVDDLKCAKSDESGTSMYYGRDGTTTSFAFCESMAELEGGAGCVVSPSGLAAIATTILSFVASGDHLLMVDSAYGPTRGFCESVLKRLGVEVTYYDPLIGADIEPLIRPNTKVVFMESPGSVTMEIQDVPAVVEVAHKHDCVVMLDNTWGAGIHFQPLNFGVDISIQAATKYVVGHSDVVLGTAVSNEKHWTRLKEGNQELGQRASPDDLYMAQRGIRTLDVRMQRHQENAIKVAKWLTQQDVVDLVLHPALPDFPGHDIFMRDFSGSNGLFSFVLKSVSDEAVAAFIDSLEHFKLGISWGGYESLVFSDVLDPRARTRAVTPWPYQNPLIRLHVGLEDAGDLIEDLSKGFERLNCV